MKRFVIAFVASFCLAQAALAAVPPTGGPAFDWGAFDVMLPAPAAAPSPVLPTLPTVRAVVPPGVPGFTPAAAAKPITAPKAAAPKAIPWGRMPLSFEANHGQVDSQVKFLARGPGYTVFLTPTETTFVLRAPDANAGKPRHGKFAGLPGVPDPLAKPADRAPDTPAAPPAVVRMKLEGANPSPAVSGLETLPGTVNYFKGNDPKKWRTGIPTYRKAHYKNVYPGIDQVWYGNPDQLEHDFVVAPGADPGKIRIAFEGLKGREDAPAVRVTETGDLALTLADGGEMRLQKPLVYQEIDGRRVEVAAAYEVYPQAGKVGLATASRASVGFRLATYDAGKPVVIDPVVVYSTYFGGSSFDGGYSIAVDPVSNIYVAGLTDSSGFPVASARYPNYAGGARCFCNQTAKRRGDGRLC